ncbi:SpoIIE family protein phosphatase [Phytoactinopolyspora halotolerans]|uniref:SpoIIE family protein phosphatase n=1 Tax=Phytoactinopolyspora halotolerans TaxID=1981512 RepID=A0A6L9SFU2_9ACTN|nr:SpoIIE family protein phosphatase [Phytoactinopolyspora halotolerans]NEE04245.1 SpoIIE family protein phosphatase [Phytoactinopolyspora halotolerans]
MRPADAQRLLGVLAGADAPVGFAVFDEQHRYLAVNAFLAERTGKAIAEHLGRRPAEVLPPELAAHTEAMIDRVLRTGETLKTDEPATPGAAGGVTYLRSTWYLVDEGERREVAMFVVDDTSQRSALSALRHSRARNARLLEVAEELAEAVTVAEVAAAVSVIGRATVGALRTSVVLIGERDRLVEVDGSATSEWPDDEGSPMIEVLRTGWPVFLGSAAQARREYRSQSFQDFLDTTDERSWALLPMSTDSGRLGVVRFAFDDEQPFESEACRFLRAVAQQCSVAFERARLFEQERTATASLTESLMPQSLPTIDGLELEARGVPGSADAVGGDWYDAFELPDGAASVVVGDVMGHGLSAASGMGQVRAALRALALADPDPAAVLAGLDRLVEGGGSVEMATVVYLVVDPAGGVVRLGDAGHLPLVRIPPAGEIELIDSGVDTTPIGVPEARHSRILQLVPGEILLAFTDGLVESRSRGLEEGVGELLSCLEDQRTAPLDTMLDNVVERLRTPGAADDLTILALRWKHL